MNRRAKAFALAAICAVALPAAGCGGASNADYKKKVKAATAQFKTDLQAATQKIQSASTTHSLSDFSAGAQQLRAATAKFTTQLSSLKPPSDTQTAQNNVIRDLNKFSADIGALSTAASTGPASATREANRQLVTDGQKVEASGNVLDQKVK